jgi:hypothetical protein
VVIGVAMFLLTVPSCSSSEEWYQRSKYGEKQSEIEVWGEAVN